MLISNNLLTKNNVIMIYLDYIGVMMMRVAIIERMDEYEPNRPFEKFCYLDNWFKEIFEELDILLIPIISSKNIDDIVSISDALVVTGSPNDIDPKYYGEELIKYKTLKFDEYPFVRKVVKSFNNAGKPILGICAGIQEINVIFGGTLYQRIEGHYLKNQTMHSINIEENSFLHDVYGKDKIEVNSYHRQAIKKLADGFKVIAKGDDGVVEGIERDNIVAVQWHPEALMDIKLFKSFIDKYVKNHFLE